MKKLVYLLILANVVFFLWETGGRSGQDADGAYRELEIPSGVERIALTHEVAGIAAAGAEPMVPATGTAVPAPTPEEPPPAEPPSEPVRPRKVPDCFLIGPSQTKAEADGFLDLLKSHAAKASVEAKPGDVPDGWWVMFPKAVSLEAGRENRRILAEKGVMDTWLFDKGPQQWAISLGLHKTREQAEAARKSFMAKNILADVVPRYVRGQVYWVKIPWPRPPLELEEIVQVLNTQDASLRIPAPIPCD